MSQKERDQIATDFRVGTSRVLITTDERIRGIDTARTGLVVSYDIPKYASRACLLAGPWLIQRLVTVTTITIVSAVSGFPGVALRPLMYATDSVRLVGRRKDDNGTSPILSS